MNGKDIYPIRHKQQVVIPVANNPSVLVASDGFHISKPVTLALQPNKLHHCKIVCAIDNELFVNGALLWVLFFVMGLAAGILVLKLFSFFPLLYFLYAFYLNKDGYIKIKAAAT